MLILSLKAGKDFVKSEESKIDKLLSKLVQTVDKTALCLVGGEKTHKKHFLKSFLRILKVLFLEKAP